jgi:hypothetical protein
VRHASSKFQVLATWEIPQPTVEVSWSENTARVTGLNNFELRHVDRFPRDPELTAECEDKIIFIRKDESFPTVKVSTCGRWHGALPQTGAAALAIAKATVPFAAELFSSDTVMHSAGVERLPKCTSTNGLFSIQIPRVNVEFRLPIY